MEHNHPVRVRFAPSPTGTLHVGGARTALFNYLFAHHHKGAFLLRIEDTDKERSDPELTETILSSLNWLGLSWDESPVYQSQRSVRHQEICSRLMQKGHAYPCFCTREVLQNKRNFAEIQKKDTGYDKTCLSLTSHQIQENMNKKMPFTLRFNIPPGETDFYDMVHGSIKIQHEQIDDFIIQRSDGSPVYQIAVITDDHDMAISHVIRGDDHLSNTSKQILLYRALGWELPQFGHLPLILGPDQKRLSKRHGATSLETYQAQGILPDALLNFIALLGWSPGNDREIMDLTTLIHEFTIERISRKAAIFDSKKLDWMNASYITGASNEKLFNLIKHRAETDELYSQPFDFADHVYVHQIIELIRPRMKSLNEYFELSRYFFSDPETYEYKAVQKYWLKPKVINRLNDVIQDLEQCIEWNEKNLEAIIRDRAEKIDVGAGKLIHPLRLAITGMGSSPGLFEVMTLLGKERVIRRLKSAIVWLQEHPV